MSSKEIEIYNSIDNTLNEMIPVKWCNLKFYGEVIGDESCEIFFYFVDDCKVLRQGLRIPKDFNVDNEIFRNAKRKLTQECFRLHKEFIDSHNLDWTNFTLSLDGAGTFNIEYYYDNPLELTQMSRRIVWLYKYYEVVPTAENDIELIDKFKAKQLSCFSIRR